MSTCTFESFVMNQRDGEFDFLTFPDSCSAERLTRIIKASLNTSAANVTSPESPFTPVRDVQSFSTAVCIPSFVSVFITATPCEKNLQQKP